jgi:hypothetical protein
MDQEMKALDKITKLLALLTPAEAERVLRYVAEKLGFEIKKREG